MEYHTLFDVTSAGYYQVWFPLTGVIFAIGGAIFAVYSKFLRPKWLRVVPRILVVFGVVWTLTALLATVVPYLRLASALRRGACTVTEGVITQFSAMPDSGHGFESFSVAAQHFKYSDYVLSPGFHKTHRAGSNIRNGLYVRVYHRGNDIARLEIAADISPAEADK